MKTKTSPLPLYWIHPHFYNWMGGHTFIYEVISRLKKTYHLDVTLITSGLTPTAKAKFAALNVPLVTLSGSSTNHPWYWLFLPVFLFGEMVYLKYVKKINQQALFISSMFPSNTLAMMLGHNLTQLCYEPFAFFYDKNFLDGFPLFYRLFAQGIKLLYQELDVKSVRANQVMWTLSQYNRAWIQAAYGVEAQVVYEGVDVAFFHHNVGPALKRKYHSFRVIFHATDYTPIKGTLHLLKALPEIVKKVPDVKLVISETIPHSPLKAEVLELIKQLQLTKYVEFAGFLPYKMLPEYLSLAKVVIQPSIQQSMNLTVKEAMACGTAVITSPEGKEQTHDGEAGFLVDPYQTSKLALQTVRCLTDAALTKKLGQKGRQIIINKFSWEGVTQKMYQTLQPYLYD